MKIFIGLIASCFLFFPTISEAKTYSTSFVPTPFFSGYQNVFAKKTDGFLSVAKDSPVTTALVGGLAIEGSLDILASDAMSLQNFHGPTGTLNMQEANPLLGEYPSFLQYDFMAPALVGVALGIGLHLPKSVRIPLLVGVVGYEGWNMATMVATFGLSTFAMPEFVVGLAVGFVVTWAVYHAVSWILDELFPPYEDPGTFLLKTYEKIQSISQSLSSYGR